VDCTLQGFFLECSVGWWWWGGITFVGRENVKNIQKANKNCYCLGRTLKLSGMGGGNIPPAPHKGPETITGTRLYGSPVSAVLKSNVAIDIPKRVLPAQKHIHLSCLSANLLSTTALLRLLAMKLFP